MKEPKEHFTRFPAGRGKFKGEECIRKIFSHTISERRIFAQFSVVLYPERIRTSSTALRSFPKIAEIEKKWINGVSNIVPVLNVA